LAPLPVGETGEVSFLDRYISAPSYSVLFLGRRDEWILGGICNVEITLFNEESCIQVMFNVFELAFISFFFFFFF
jgi:hypothetical protein